MNQSWCQFTIIHLSDIHFGPGHRFDPPRSPLGDCLPRRGEPTLAESILKDLNNGNIKSLAEFKLGSKPGELISGHELDSIESLDGPSLANHRLLVALTGDFTQKATTEEFRQAEEFIQQLCDKKFLGCGVEPRHIFVIPGNHDLEYAEVHVADRWDRYIRFEKKLSHIKGEVNASEYLDAAEPEKLSRIIDMSADGLIVAAINTCSYIVKDSPDERRGQVDHATIYRLEQQLKAIPKQQRERSIRLAFMHHHPVVLPVLAEPGEGYDAVVFADRLLALFKRYGFHVVLHGHKHNPHTFSYDVVSAWTTEAVHPLMIVAGGSAGSSDLPSGQPRATNSYNLISIKWHPGAQQARVHIETRGLVRHDEQYHELSPFDWNWTTLRLDDRVLAPPRAFGRAAKQVRQRTEDDKKFDDQRRQAAEATRRYFPAIEVLPSLKPEQGYEARVWIEAQERTAAELPVRVEWSAGKWFDGVIVCDRDQDPTFSARFAYWGPVLIQARLYWSDESVATAYIFARLPSEES